MAAEHYTPTPGNGQSPHVIKPIETIYNGYRFRSRLEARWAVFLDGCHIEYQYEPEGIDLGGIWYLPDFYLPRLNCWFEVKGGPITDEASHKAYMLCRATKRSVIIAGDQFNDTSRFMFYYWWHNAQYFTGVLTSTEIIWGQCCVCGMIAPVAWNVLANEVYRLASIAACTCGEDDGTECWDYMTPTIEGLYLGARRARFEHGETPQP